MKVEDAVDEILGDLLGIWGNLVPDETLLELVEALLEKPLIGERVDEVLRDILDVEVSVQEDCLHLAVSTPSLPKYVFPYSFSPPAAENALAL